MPRAIDIYEGSITEVLRLAENGSDPSEAYDTVAANAGITAGRLMNLTLTWCGLARIATPEQHAVAYRDAYLIAWIGACNAKAVQRSLSEHETVLGEAHDAVAAIRGHLDYLRGKGLGPETDVLVRVRDIGQDLI